MMTNLFTKNERIKSRKNFALLCWPICAYLLLFFLWNVCASINGDNYE
jgi:hypothetical protein